MGSHELASQYESLGMSTCRIYSLAQPSSHSARPLRLYCVTIAIGCVYSRDALGGFIDLRLQCQGILVYHYRRRAQTFILVEGACRKSGDVYHVTKCTMGRVE